MDVREKLERQMSTHLGAWIRRKATLGPPFGAGTPLTCHGEVLAHGRRRHQRRAELDLA